MSQKFEKEDLKASTAEAEAGREIEKHLTPGPSRRNRRSSSNH